MPHPLRWRDVLPGLAAFIILAGIAAVVVATGNVSTLHGKTIRVHVAMSAARGLAKGSDVWLAGSPVGRVAAIGFAPPSADTMERVIVDIDILAKYREQIRRDAEVRIGSGGSFIGAPVLAFEAGTPSAPPIESGDTLHARQQNDPEQLASDVTLASRELPPIMANVKLISTQLQSATGTLGALGIERGEPQLGEVLDRAARVTHSLRSGSGTIGLAMSGPGSLQRRAQQALASVDSVKALLASDRSSLGRFRRDSSLQSTIGDLRNELSIVQARLTAVDGTLGRARADSAIIAGLGTASREMTTLFADISRHPFRYVRF